MNRVAEGGVEEVHSVTLAIQNALGKVGVFFCIFKTNIKLMGLFAKGGFLRTLHSRARWQTFETRIN
jgi:hypothetical protein